MLDVEHSLTSTLKMANAIVKVRLRPHNYLRSTNSRQRSCLGAK